MSKSVKVVENDPVSVFDSVLKGNSEAEMVSRLCV